MAGVERGRREEDKRGGRESQTIKGVRGGCAARDAAWARFYSIPGWVLVGRTVLPWNLRPWTMLAEGDENNR